jgi:hypothetical protein
MHPFPQPQPSLFCLKKVQSLYSTLVHTNTCIQSWGAEGGYILWFILWISPTQGNIKGGSRCNSIWRPMTISPVLTRIYTCNTSITSPLIGYNYTREKYFPLQQFTSCFHTETQFLIVNTDALGTYWTLCPSNCLFVKLYCTTGMEI